MQKCIDDEQACLLHRGKQCLEKRINTALLYSAKNVDTRTLLSIMHSVIVK